MTVTPTTSLNSTNSLTGTSTTNNNLAGITGEDFMQVLIKQLQFQDPLKPMDNEQMVQQMATIRQLETNTQLSDKLSQLTGQQRFAGAAALIGKHVKGTTQDADGNAFPAEGNVKGITFTDKGDVILDLDSGQQLPLSKLEQVLDGAAATSTTPGAVAANPETSPTAAKQSIGARLLQALTGE